MFPALLITAAVAAGSIPSASALASARWPARCPAAAIVLWQALGLGWGLGRHRGLPRCRAEGAASLTRLGTTAIPAVVTALLATGLPLRRRIGVIALLFLLLLVAQRLHGRGIGTGVQRQCRQQGQAAAQQGRKGDRPGTGKRGSVSGEHGEPHLTA